MDLKAKLRETRYPHHQWDILSYVCEGKEQFAELISCFFSDDLWLSHRACLLILEVEKDQPTWVKEQVPAMVALLSNELPDWKKRNILRILQKQEIPEAYWGPAADQCFNYLSSPEEQVAVKVFSMSVIYNLTKEVPELARELRLLIEDPYPMGSAGFKARSRQILKQLDKNGL